MEGTSKTEGGNDAAYQAHQAEQAAEQPVDAQTAKLQEMGWHHGDTAGLFVSDTKFSKPSWINSDDKSEVVPLVKEVDGKFKPAVASDQYNSLGDIGGFEDLPLMDSIEEAAARAESLAQMYSKTQTYEEAKAIEDFL